MPPTLRRANFFDLFEIAQVIALSFKDEQLFGRIIHPHQDQYPNDPALWWHKRNLRDYFDWSYVFLVTTEKKPDGRERITGVAKWHRLGPGARTSGWGLPAWDPRNVLKPLFGIYAKISSFFYPNRAVDPAKEDVLERSLPFLTHVWTGDRAESWYLDCLGVHPNNQGQGLGRDLVAWGMREAEEEGVSASVIAAAGRDRFYQACGFDQYAGNACAGEGNPLADVPPGNIWFRDVKKK